MVSKSLVALAAATFAGEALAASIHRGHEHLHVAKRDIVTHMVTHTAWTTVTVTLGQSADPAPTAVDNNTKLTKSRVSSSSAAVAVPAEASSAAPSINIVVPNVAGNVAVVNAPASPSATQNNVPAAAPSTTTPELTGGKSSGNRLQRGLAYNDGALLSSFLGNGHKATWTYNWGQTDDSHSGLEFVPMLWGTKNQFEVSWPANAEQAIKNGSTALLSFNEPDIPEQANMDPGTAAAKHKLYMNPFAGKARISSPSITNSGSPGMGLDWMQKFFDACNGECRVDFLALHSYGTDAQTVLNHLLDAYNRFKLPVWITELGFQDPKNEVKTTKNMEYFLDQLENNSTFSFVERFSYFMVAVGDDKMMSSSSQLRSFAKVFAYGA
ncbi:glycosyl hydrolase catalytic core-domain-containing protein [Sordaria brevicollis]|uniref:Glycosyl hydrolase catalytic core-domain-containing protein n=1 Tax=Sordaria brevicollis TaxID=83679 RepID=A0AAE0PCC5_SORBR|nr:glycosyl hydrolase catalytic core-domain-containing protein [Sordaria brevicollis]